MRTPPAVAALPLLSLLVVLSPAVTRAGDPPPYTAAAGEELARSAAAAWAEDARLVYIENDDPLNGDGSSVRWGYLFHSADRGKSRAYSIKGGKIKTAEDLSFDFEPPPLPAGWIDSGQALAVADKKEGLDFRAKHGGTIRAMVLARGLLDPEKPDSAAWAIVYDSPSAPPLWVVVNAKSGEVVRKWRG